MRPQCRPEQAALWQMINMGIRDPLRINLQEGAQPFEKGFVRAVLFANRGQRAVAVRLHFAFEGPGLHRKGQAIRVVQIRQNFALEKSGGEKRAERRGRGILLFLLFFLEDIVAALALLPVIARWRRRRFNKIPHDAACLDPFLGSLLLATDFEDLLEKHKGSNI